jgi:protocatechuate 3,4-dioxygenase beta subunit
VRSQGLPVASVTVAVYEYSFEADSLGDNDTAVCEQVTGARGDFKLAVRPGKYRLEAQPDKNTRFVKATVSEIDVFANTSCNLNLSTGAIATCVVRTANGTILDFGEIIASGIEPISYCETSKLDESGRHSLTLPKGKYHLAFRVSEALAASTTSESENQGPGSRNSETSGVSQSYEQQSYLVPSVTVVDITRDVDLNLTMPELVTFTGEVVDMLGHPVSEAQIIVSPSDEMDDPVLLGIGLRASATADSAGKFSMQVQPGVYRIMARPATNQPLSSVEDAKVPILKDTHYSFRLVEGFRLRGQVRFGTKVLSNCLIRIAGVDKEANLFARTNAEGQVNVNLPSGTYKIVVTAHPKDAPSVTIDGAEHSSLAPWTRIIRVGGETHVAANVEEGTAVYGFVKDDSGAPRAGINVAVFPSNAEVNLKTKSERALCDTITDGEGRFCFFLSPGEYDLVVHTDIVNATKVEVKSEPVEIELNWHGWCQIKFEITGEDGKPIPRCRIGYGPYAAAGLATPSPIAGIATSSVASSGTNGASETTATATSGAAFEGRTTNAPASDPQTNLPHGYFLTGEDGNGTITLPSGIYTLRFTPPHEGSYEQRSLRQISFSHDMVKAIKLPLKGKSS